MKKQLIVSLLLTAVLLSATSKTIFASTVTPSTSTPTATISENEKIVRTNPEVDLQKSSSSNSARINSAIVGDLSYHFYQDGTAEIYDIDRSRYDSITSLTIPVNVINPQDDQYYEVTEVLPYSIYYLPNLTSINFSGTVHFRQDSIYYNNKLTTMNGPLCQDMSKIIDECPNVDQSVFSNSVGLTDTFDMPVGYFIVDGQEKYIVLPNHTVKLVQWFTDNTTDSLYISETISYRGIRYTVTSIGHLSVCGGGFDSLKWLRLPDTLKNIEPDSFDGLLGLTKVEIPAGLDMTNVFINCPSLDRAQLNFSTNYTYDDFINYWNHMTATSTKSISYNNISYDLLSDGNANVIGNTLPNSASTLSIPPYVTDQSTGKVYKVTAINANSFSNKSNLVSITLPDTIVEVKSNSFNNDANLSNVSVYNKTFLDDNVVQNCAKLNSTTGITIRQGPTTYATVTPSSTAVSTSTVSTISPSAVTADSNSLLTFLVLLYTSFLTLVKSSKTLNKKRVKITARNNHQN